MAKRKTKLAGFTLIEVLLVVGILTILVSITVAVVRPGDQFDKANDNKRLADVTAILNAIHAYTAANGGQLPADINSLQKTITSNFGGNVIDLCPILVPDYISDIPIDPVQGVEIPEDSLCDDAGASYNAEYTVQAAGGNRVTVAAPHYDGDEEISITR